MSAPREILEIVELSAAFAATERLIWENDCTMGAICRMVQLHHGAMLVRKKRSANRASPTRLALARLFLSLARRSRRPLDGLELRVRRRAVVEVAVRVSAILADYFSFERVVTASWAVSVHELRNADIAFSSLHESQ